MPDAEKVRFSKQLRKQATEAEQQLWQHLRAHQCAGLKFRRQQPMGTYIVDFICFEKKLIIEVDGGQHQETVMYDAKRDEWLGREGYKVLRFWNGEVLTNLEGVLIAIHDAAVSPSPSPPPLKGGG